MISSFGMVPGRSRTRAEAGGGRRRETETRDSFAWLALSKCCDIASWKAFSGLCELKTRRRQAPTLSSGKGKVVESGVSESVPHSRRKASFGEDSSETSSRGGYGAEEEEVEGAAVLRREEEE